MDVAQLSTTAPPLSNFPQPGPNEMPLSALLETAIQRTYHQLMVMTDMFPSLSDKDKKIELVTFACKTRQLFMRIFALVKFRKSSHINVSSILQFLDQQSFIFVDTADFLYNLARVKLVNARLPNFAITTAVDVLTLGTYTKLPTCIKERILPAEAMSDLDKEKTLKDLNRIIQCRLALSDLPSQFNNFKIQRGHVGFVVNNEFEVLLTVPSDDYKQPWRLLFIKILVKNSQDPNRTLVHQLQVKYIHELLQKRLYENDKPLIDLYKSLHYFCQSLKLEVLFQQMYALNEITYARFYRIIEYSSQTKLLTIKYWLEYSKSDYDFRFTILTQESSSHLQTLHYPPLNWKDHKEIDTIFKSDELLIEKIIHQIISIRSRIRLNELRSQIDFECVLDEVTPCLRLNFFGDNRENEIMFIKIDFYSGLFYVQLPIYSNLNQTSILSSIEQALNSDLSKLKEALYKLKAFLVMYRCESFVKIQTSKLVNYELPIVSFSNEEASTIYSKIEKNRLFIELNRHQTDKIYLVIVYSHNEDESQAWKYYLIKITKCKFEGDPDANMQFYKLTSISQLKKSSFLQNQNDFKDTNLFGEVKQVLACVNDRLPMMNFVLSFNKNNILTQSIQVDDRLHLTKLNMLDMPKLDGKEMQSISAELWDQVISCTVRHVHNLHKPSLIQTNIKQVPIKFNFSIEFKFSRCLWTSIQMSRVIDLYIIHLDVKNFDGLYEALNQEWFGMCQMYKLLRQMNRALNYYHEKFKIIDFNFKRLIVAYGSSFANRIQFSWSKDQYDIYLASHISKGSIEIPSLNYHYYFINEIRKYFSENPFANVIPLVVLLSDSVQAAHALCKLQNLPKFMLTPQHLLVSQPGFMCLVISLNHVKLSYLTRYYLDIYFDSFNLIHIKPYLFVQTQELYEDLQAIYSFLQLFRDASVDDALKRKYLFENNMRVPLTASQHVFLPPTSPAVRQSPYFAQSPHVTNPSPYQPQQPQQHHDLNYSQSPAAINYLASPATNTSSPFNSEFQSLHSPLPAKSPYATTSTIQRCRPNSCVYLSHSGFFRMLNSYLEIFLSSLSLKRTIAKLIQQYQNFPGFIRLQLLSEITPTSYCSFSLMLTTLDQQQIQLDALQEYLNTRVLCAPFRPSSIIAFMNLITIQDLKTLKEFIQLLTYEIKANNEWRLKFFWTTPYGYHTRNSFYQQMYQPGQSAFKRDQQNKIYFIFFLQNSSATQMYAYMCMYDSMSRHIQYEQLLKQQDSMPNSFDNQIMDLLNHGIMLCKQRNDPNLALFSLMHLLNTLNQQQGLVQPPHSHQQQQQPLPQIIPQQHMNVMM